MCSFKHVSMCVSVCLNVSLGACWGACVCVFMPVHVNRCSGLQPVAPFCSLSAASNHTTVQYSMSKLQLIPDLLSEQLPRVLWGRTASWTSSCPLTYSMGGGRERHCFFLTLLCVCLCIRSGRGLMMIYQWEKQRRRVFNACFCSNSMTVSTTKWTKTCLATISITKTQCTADCGKEGTGARLCQLTVF